MADQKKICGEIHDISAKAQELLTHLSSTVFACDISGDTRYIRCDFPQCSQHAEALQGKPCWILNTLKNVRVLERHVGKEVHHYMKGIDSGTHDQMVNRHYVDSQHWIDAQGLPEGTRKVLAVFNLKDPQSQFGDWISLFLKAAFLAEGLQQHGCIVITQNFVSRHELMECIAKLKFLNSRWPTVEVVAVLSCHSSCQGQVFSCTPFAVGKQCGFEEFCSLRDFVMACQSVLSNVLMAVHISSCFTLKLDCSHADWPVDADWLKTKLQCFLCGSIKEVYETGSQVADLHLMLSTMLPCITVRTCGTGLRDAVYRACAEGFPDLAREMGLEVLDPDTVDQRLSREGKEDQVTPPGLVMSSVRVVLLVQDEDLVTSSKDPDEARHCGSYIALADAITANLQIRKASDVKFEYTVVQMKQNDTCLLKESLKKHLSLLPCDSFKVLFIAIGPMFSRLGIELIDVIKEWSSQKTDGVCYGVHFQHITAMQAYAIKNRLKQIHNDDTSASSAEKSPSERHLAVTGLVDNGNTNCSASFPVLLYMIHLAVGENGNRLAGKGIPSAVYSNKPVGHGVSSWTLEEVYMETCHVLSGLSRKCGLHLLSPAANPMRPALVIGTSQSSVCATSSETTTLKSVCEKDEHVGLSSSDVQPTTSCSDVGSSFIITAVPTNTGATTKEGNALESVQNEDGSSSFSNFNRKLVTVNDKPVSALSDVKPLSTISSLLTIESSSSGIGNNSNFENKPTLGNEETGHITVVNSQEMDENNGVSSSDVKIFAVDEEPDCVTFDQKPSSLTIDALVDYSSSSEEEGKLIHDDDDGFDEEQIGLACLQKESLSIGAFLKDASLPEEDRVTSKLVGGMFYETLSATISQAVTNVNHPEGERSAVTLVHDGQGVPCLPKELPTVLEDATLSGDGENTVSLEDNVDEVEPVGLTCLKKESSTIGAFPEDKSSSEKKAKTMNLYQDDNELDEKPVSEIRDDGEDRSYVPIASYVGVDDTEPKGLSLTESDVENSSMPQSDTGTKIQLQTWCQFFQNYCEEQKSVEARESSQDPPHKRRRKNVPTSVEKDCMSGNLESNNECLGVTKGCILVPEMPSTTAPSSAMDLNLSNTSGDHVVTPSHVENETESDSVRNAEAAQFKNTNFFEIMEAKEMHVNSEDSCPRKRPLPLLINYSSDTEERLSVKKPKHEPECESKCGTTTEEPINSAGNDWDKSDDLPLMANVDEVLVSHYILDLSVHFTEKTMKGSIVLFVEPSNKEVTKRQFQMTLDSTLVNIESVSEVVLPDDFKLTFFGHEQSSPLTQEASSSFLGNILGHNTQNPLPFKGLPYSVYGWFVRIWKPDATGKTWPRCIWIKYHTSPEGKSLTWATDQDGKPCVYSPGAYINNRSLMPCQEPPVAMASWQASIHVPEGCVVLMSGNELVGKTTARDGEVTFLYEMRTPLPCSTLAVAVGWWQCRQSRNADTKDGANPKVPVTCRLFAPPSLIDRAADELLGYAPKFLEASCELLGPYPFRRLDMLIMPKCFACMGLKSPNLVFLSQSLLSGDASMRVRLAHEISHAWFGLLVGTKDWSEEWLSEGFATFIEEKIQSRAEKWSKDKDRFYREMRQILRHRCLLFEIKECDDSLKYLRPKVVKPSRALSTAEAIEKSASQADAVRPHTVVQFGQICSRKWTQVHYLKGYFLLHHLAMMVGLEEFDTFLFNYVQHYKGQLVSSEEFFEFFVQSFPEVSRETKEKFVREWLERAGLPKSFPKRFDSPDNELVSQVVHEFQIWKKQDATNKRNKTLRVRKRTKPPTSILELPEQVVLFLEKLLERETLSHNTLRQLDKCYNFSDGNAEIRHRWCELVVKHKFIPGLQEVKRFLVEDQGMGIYLFGELIISQQPKQRALVDEVLEEISAEMDRCTYQTVKDMLEGND